jgi:hypothetical protein
MAIELDMSSCVIPGQVCIFCRQVGSSEEHVVPKSLGGNCIIRCVCAPCNTGFSLIDSALAEHSPVAFSKIVETSPSVCDTKLGGRVSTWDKSGRRLQCRLHNEMRAEIVPQIFWTGDGDFRVHVGNREALNGFIEFIDDQFSSGNLARIYVESTDEASEPCLVMYRSDSLKVRCSDATRGKQFLDFITAHWSDIRRQLQTTSDAEGCEHTPSVLIELAAWPNEEFRAIAKIAFETMAMLCGCAFPLQACFDSVREYIKGDVQLSETAPNQVPVDTRFVRRLEEDFPLTFTDAHGVLLISEPPWLIAFVELYGYHRYRVNLSDSTGAPRWMKAYEFSFDKSGHREIGTLELAARFDKYAPTVLSQGARDQLQRVAPERYARPRSASLKLMPMRGA